MNSHNRRIWSLTACVLLTLHGCASTPMLSTPGQTRLTCESESPGGDYREFSCPTVASGTTHRFRFRASFSGSHDDTSVSMTPTLDTLPLTCAPGSKTRLMGEDGDVSLECTFSVTELGQGRHVLGVVLRWSHAQYTGFEFDAVE